MKRWIGWILVLASLSCVSAEKESDEVDAVKIRRAATLEELMELQGELCEDTFDYARELDAKTMTARDLGILMRMGSRLKVATERLSQFSLGAEFDLHTQKLAAVTDHLARRILAGDPKGALEATAAVEQTCMECHRFFR